jgi:hypothetical protein
MSDLGTQCQVGHLLTLPGMTLRSELGETAGVPGQGRSAVVGHGWETGMWVQCFQTQDAMRYAYC